MNTRLIRPLLLCLPSLGLAVTLAALLPAATPVQAAKPEKAAMSLTLTSTAFQQGQPIPQKHTCQGEDVSPPLKWTGAPANTKTFALICDDPDAPIGTWVHWVIFNLPASTTSLAENVAKTETLPDGAVQGNNDFKRAGYGGPCPPPGKPHRYFFKVYALDATLALKPGSKKRDVLSAMKGHILAEGELMGAYQRK